MDPVHQLAGPAGSALSERTHAAYYAAIAQRSDGDGGTVRHLLRPEIGDGTIEVTPLPGGFELARYDVAFTGGHRLGYRFPGDHFELEHCVGGRLRVTENAAGAGELAAGAVALSPRYATEGTVRYGDGERYRAVSVTGTWSGLAAHLAGLGAHPLPAAVEDADSRQWYLRGSAALYPAAGPLAEIFLHRRMSPGRMLYLQSRVTAALAALLDGLSTPQPPRHTDPELHEHELAALRRIPELLWHARHAPPSLAALARASSMSVRRLRTGFHALYGTTVLAQHRRTCLARAAELLVETDWPVQRIAHEVGYASAGNFGYAFRRDRGSSPARFRRAHR